jgi:hypothetical protein
MISPYSRASQRLVETETSRREFSAGRSSSDPPTQAILPCWVPGLPHRRGGGACVAVAGLRIELALVRTIGDVAPGLSFGTETFRNWVGWRAA